MIPQDAIELLLPGAEPETADRARRVATFLRLLASDAGPTPAGSVRVSLERARGELEHDTLCRLGAAVADLLRHHLTGALGAESFCWLGRARMRPQSAWSLLEEAREERPGIAEVPEPGESALSVAARLFETARRLQLPRCDPSLFEAHLCRAKSGPRAGEEAFRALFEAGSELRGSAAALAGWVECALDRGAVAAAAVLLEENAALARSDDRLARLTSWVQLLRGVEPGRSSDLLDRGRTHVPASLADLRDRRPEWLTWLAGRRAEMPHTAAGGAIEVRCRERSDWGAVLLGVFALQQDGSQRALHLDVAPALQERLEAWLFERDGACGVSGQPERAVVVRPELIVWHRRDTDPLPGALGPASLALVLAPILDDMGEVAGWLRLEFEHHLVPARARLEALAAGWRTSVLAARGPDGSTLR